MFMWTPLCWPIPNLSGGVAHTTLRTRPSRPQGHAASQRTRSPRATPADLGVCGGQCGNVPTLLSAEAPGLPANGQLRLAPTLNVGQLTSLHPSFFHRTSINDDPGASETQLRDHLVHYPKLHFPEKLKRTKQGEDSQVSGRAGLESASPDLTMKSPL